MLEKRRGCTNHQDGINRRFIDAATPPYTLVTGDETQHICPLTERNPNWLTVATPQVCVGPIGNCDVGDARFTEMPKACKRGLITERIVSHFIPNGRAFSKMSSIRFQHSLLHMPPAFLQAAVFRLISGRLRHLFCSIQAYPASPRLWALMPQIPLHWFLRFLPSIETSHLTSPRFLCADQIRTYTATLDQARLK